LKLAPFHLLASKGAVSTSKQHTWHMEILFRLCAADSVLLLATSFRDVDFNDPASCEAATQWWVESTAAGNDGMVVKPQDYISKNRRGIAQPQSNAATQNTCASSAGPTIFCREIWTRSAPAVLGPGAHWQAGNLH
jgi:protein phosphatase